MNFYMDEKYTVELPVEENEIVINDNVPLSEVNKEKTVRIYWNWEYKTGNTEEEIYENIKNVLNDCCCIKWNLIYKILIRL